MPELLTRAAFAPHQNTVFTVQLGEDEHVDMELVEVSERTPEGFDGEQFSLVFQGPHEPVLGQRIYPMKHAELGQLELFLVPIGEPPSGRLYEAFFNRLAKGEG